MILWKLIVDEAKELHLISDLLQNLNDYGGVMNRRDDLKVLILGL